MNLNEALAIDRNNLDEEAIRVPGWYGWVAQKEANARDRLEYLLDKKKILRADIGLMIRGWTLPQVNQFFGIGLNKLTEGAYKDLVMIHPEVIKLYNDISQARHEQLLYRAAMNALDKKGDMLKEIGRLLAQGYFMKIEGREYKEPKMELMVKKIAHQLIERAEKEQLTQPVPEPAMDTLQTRLNSLNPSIPGPAPGVSPPAAIPPVKTPKTPKMQRVI